MFRISKSLLAATYTVYDIFTDNSVSITSTSGHEITAFHSGYGVFENENTFYSLNAQLDVNPIFDFVKKEKGVYGYDAMEADQIMN